MSENKGDLISRKDLKKQINNCEYFHSSFQKMTVAEFLTIVYDLIDNAPTVEAVEFECHSKLIKQAYQKGKDIRPHGEWIEVKPHQSDLEDGIDYREECSICHEPNRHYGFDEYHDIRFATYYKTNFCPNCGADMRRGGTE